MTQSLEHLRCFITYRLLSIVSIHHYKGGRLIVSDVGGTNMNLFGALWPQRSRAFHPIITVIASDEQSRSRHHDILQRILIMWQFGFRS